MTAQPADATKRGIVTGAGSGLGRAIALRLARDGWYLALVDLKLDRAEETLGLVRAAGGQGRAEACNVAKREDWAALRSRLEDAWQHVDLLVNNAGVAGGGEVGQFSLDDWEWVLDTNLLGAVNGCHTFLDWLKRNPHGASIINIASMAAIAQAPAMAAYNVSKAGVLSLSETLQAELGKGNVWVTVVCPKFFQTKLLEAARITGDGLRDVAAHSMQQANFTADDVADAAVRGMYRRQFYVFVPRRAKFLWRLKRLMPNFFVHFMRKKYTEGLPESV